MDTEKDLLKYLLKEKIHSFTTKNLAEKLKEEMNIPKIKTKIWVSIFKTNKLIERVSTSGNCQTTCASCYEYGCDAVPKAPINFWRLKQ